jgi:signal transduction histidine kinase
LSSIKDTGIGIDQDRLSAIFWTLTKLIFLMKSLQGAGLGLAISKAYVGC